MTVGMRHDVFWGSLYPSFRQTQWEDLNMPSGKRLHNYGKIHHFSWVNQLFLWPFSIAFVCLPEGMASTGS